jgi:hypothetical protein
VWVGIVLITKLTLIGIMMIFEQPMEKVGDLALSVFEPYPKVELLFIMIILPVFLNALMFWVTDSYLKDNSAPLAMTQATEKTLLFQKPVSLEKQTEVVTEAPKQVSYASLS